MGYDLKLEKQTSKEPITNETVIQTGTGSTVDEARKNMGSGGYTVTKTETYPEVPKIVGAKYKGGSTITSLPSTKSKPSSKSGGSSNNKSIPEKDRYH